MRKLAVLCPTKRRPEAFKTMAESMRQTSNASLIAYVDSDDATSPVYEGGERTIIERRRPIGRGRAVNDLCESYRDFDDYLVVSDDITFSRSGWDADLSAAMESFPGGIGVAHLSGTEPDHDEPRPWANWVCVSRNWIDALGWFNYPQCKDFCQDTIIQVLGEALGKIERIEPPAVFHHVMRTEDMMERLAADQSQFLWFMAAHFGTCLKKLQNAIP